MTDHIQRFAGSTDGLAFHEPVVIVYARELNALEQQVEGLEDALEHCGYDPTDCIDCGGPPHNKWCRFWKLRDFVPALFDLASQEEA
jgi:hypothetical protein